MVTISFKKKLLEKKKNATKGDHRTGKVGPPEKGHLQEKSIVSPQDSKGGGRLGRKKRKNCLRKKSVSRGGGGKTRDEVPPEVRIGRKNLGTSPFHHGGEKHCLSPGGDFRLGTGAYPRGL